MITAETFEQKTGRAPDQDDLHRCNCDKAGELGHWFCGWCQEHDKPRFMCGCLLQKPTPSMRRMRYQPGQETGVKPTWVGVDWAEPGKDVTVISKFTSPKWGN